MNILTILKNKVTPIITGFCLSLVISLGIVGYLYVDSLQTIAALEETQISMESRLLACSDELSKSLSIQSDINESTVKVDEKKDQSREDFSSLKDEFNKLRKDCSKEENKDEKVFTNTDVHDTDIDNYYRLLFRAHCLSTGSGSCDGSREIFQ